LLIFSFVLLLSPEIQMKTFAIILSLYVLALSAIPCIDIHKDMAKSQIEISQNNQDAHNQGDKDHCSPFCTCNCCATSVIILEHLVQLDSFSFFEKQYFPVSSTFFDYSLASIWQPPKIA